MRFYSSITTLRSDFNRCDRVEDQHVIDGNLSSAQPSLTVENIQLHLANLQRNTSYFFALTVSDEAGRVSETSNTVNLVFLSLDHSCSEEPTAGRESPAEVNVDIPSQNDKGLRKPMLITCIALVGFVLSVIIILGVIFVTRRKRAVWYVGQSESFPTF